MADNKQHPTDTQNSATKERDRRRETANKPLELDQQRTGKSEGGNAGKSDGASGQRPIDSSREKSDAESDKSSDTAR